MMKPSVTILSSEIATDSDDDVSLSRSFLSQFFFIVQHPRSSVDATDTSISFGDSSPVCTSSILDPYTGYNGHRGACTVRARAPPWAKAPAQQRNSRVQSAASSLSGRLAAGRARNVPVAWDRSVL